MANPAAVFHTSMGVFAAEIFVEQMPITGGNFVALARGGFYDGLHFHLVVRGFAIGFGCPFTRDPHDPRAGTGGPPHWIPDEFLVTAQFSNEPGTLAMTNRGRPNTGGSQFFINLADNSYLDWFRPGPTGHPVFGRVIRGWNVVETIGMAATDIASQPIEPIRVDRVEIQ